MNLFIFETMTKSIQILSYYLHVLSTKWKINTHSFPKYQKNNLKCFLETFPLKNKDCFILQVNYKPNLNHDYLLSSLTV